MSKYHSEDVAAITQVAALLFEGQSGDDAKQFAVSFMENISVDVDLLPVRVRLCEFMLDENLPTMKANLGRVSAMDIPGDLKSAAMAAIEGAVVLYEKDGYLSKSEAELACKTAEATANMIRSAGTTYRSAEDAVISALWYCRAMESSNISAAWSTADAVWSAALSAKHSDRSAGLSGRPARSAAYKRYANELIQLLRYAQ